MESTASLYTDRFRRILEKLMKNKDLSAHNEDVKEWLGHVLQDVNAQIERYASPVVFFEDLSTLFEHAIATRTGAEAVKKLKSIQKNVLEGHQVGGLVSDSTFEVWIGHQEKMIPCPQFGLFVGVRVVREGGCREGYAIGIG